MAKKHLKTLLMGAAQLAQPQALPKVQLPPALENLGRDKNPTTDLAAAQHNLRKAFTPSK